MQYIQLQIQDPATIPSASAGAFNLFIDQNSSTIAIKDSAGETSETGGGSGFPFTGSADISGSLSVEGIIYVNQNQNFIGQKVSFTKTPYSSSQIDIIEPGITEIARGNNQGIFNAALELSYTNDLSPSGTLWNSKYTDPQNYGWGDLQSVPYRIYSDWETALNNAVGNNIIDLPMVMHDTSTSKYYLVKFNQWTAGNQGGGFSYDRYEVLLPQSSSFAKPNYSTGTQDTISPGVVIARGNNKGIYNSVLESVYDDNGYHSPLGTRWNSIYTDPANYGWGNLSNVKNRTYDSWAEAMDYYPPQAVSESLQLVMHDVTEDKYYAVKFTQWTQGGNGGGFAYERTLIDTAGTIVFPDGTSQSTAFDASSLPIKTQGSTIYSTNPKAGPNFSSNNSIFLGQEAGAAATNAYESNFLGSNAGYSASLACYSNFLGPSAGAEATNAYNSNFIGYYAGFQATNANNSNFLGQVAGNSATNAAYSNFLGYFAGFQATNANNSNFLGQYAGYEATNACFSNFLGQSTGFQATNANSSNFLGNQAGFQAANACNSNFLGYLAGYQATNAAYSNFLGYFAGREAACASNSNFLGQQAGWQATNACVSNFLGSNAGYLATNACFSNFLGNGAGFQATDAYRSNFIGQEAGSQAASASYSTLIGYRVGWNILGGALGIKSNNIIIGTNITLEDGRQDSINFGGIIFGTGSYSNVGTNPFSGSAGGRIGINQPLPQYTLDVSGSGNYSDGLIVSGTIIQEGLLSSKKEVQTSYLFTTEGISYVNYSSSGLEQVWNSQMDDDYFEIALPFTHSFLGQNYTSIYFGTNQYFTLGAGSTEYYPLGPTNPPLPGYQIAAIDAYNFELWTGSLDSGQTFQAYVVASDRYSNNQNRAYTFRIVSGSGEIELHFERMSVGVSDVPDSSGVVNGVDANYILDISSNIVTGTDYAFKIVPQYITADKISLNITGSVSASYFYGNGSGLTNIKPISVTGSTIYSNDPFTGQFSTCNSIFLGDRAGYGATNACLSNFLGQWAGYQSINAYNSNFLGYSAGWQATNANNSNFLGVNVGWQATNACWSNFLGLEAGYGATNASYSNFIGSSAGSFATCANNSNFIGSNAGYSASAANNSNFLGAYSGQCATNAQNSNFLGSQAGQCATNAYNSNFLGTLAGYQATDANSSNFLGDGAGWQATNASYSNFLGSATGYEATNACYSNFLGQNAGQQATSGAYSNFIGRQAGQYATNASYANFLGYLAGYQATNACCSNFLGNQAGFQAASASYSTLIGLQVGYNPVGGACGIKSNNIIIGTNITLENGRQDSINLGGIIFGTGSYSTIGGNPFSGSAGGRIGINQPLPQYELDVSGSIALSDLLVLSTKDPLPTSNVPSASVMASGSGVNLKPYFWNGSTWTALF